jgi:hypothetical protein
LAVFCDVLTHAHAQGQFHAIIDIAGHVVITGPPTHAHGYHAMTDD